MTNSEEIIDKRYRNFMLLLYKDSGVYNFDDLLFDLKGSFKNYAYILHVAESNEKKNHVHFILNLENARTIESLSNRLGLSKNYIQPIKSLRASCRYLTHKDDDSKIQYNLSDVVCSNSFKSKFFGAYDDLMSDDEILSCIYQYIRDRKDYNSIDVEIDLSLYVSQCGYERVFKRYYNSIVKYIIYTCN